MKIYSPVFSAATGWVLGQVVDHVAHPCTREEIDAVCLQLNRPPSPDLVALANVCENLGGALERQRRIDELSPAAHVLEQKVVDQIYLEAALVLQEVRR